MASKYIWIRGKRYYLWGSFDTWQEAYNEYKRYKKKNKKNRYYIQKVEQGFFFPECKYKLYMTHVFKLW